MNVGLILIIVIPHQQRVKKVFISKSSISFSSIKSTSICHIWAFLNLKKESIFTWSCFSCMCFPPLSLSFSIYIHTYACQCMPVDTPRCKYMCARVYTFFIVYVYTRIRKDSNNLKILELNPFFGPSHFILETFPDKWPSTVSLNHPCVRSSLWYKGVPVTRTPVIVGKHFLLPSGNLPPAAPACRSRCILCGRIQESPSPSSSCLVETMTSVPPAPFCLWSPLQTPGLGLGTVPRVIVSLLMHSSRQPEKNVFGGFFKNNS